VRKFGSKFIQGAREHTPAAKKNIEKKAVPFGGIGFAVYILLLIPVVYFYYPKLFLILLISLLFFVIGFVDDFLKIHKKSHIALSGKLRLLLEFIISSIFVYFLYDGDSTTQILIPYYGIIKLNLLYLYLPFAVCIVVACANSFNLSDGMDGLASMQAISIFGFLAIYSFITKDREMVFLSMIIIGIMMGFLLFNTYKASVFMGDNGSLMIGSIVGMSFVSSKIEFSLIFAGFIIMIESLSVILQVLSFKLRNGKRIFKCSPIHHHFEMCGINETKIVFAFFAINVFLSAICLTSIL
jgi:phospho-N-acetylmuramoyl-pentapeptide-transferase